MSKKGKISSLVFNSFINDSRVLKEAMSLQNNGYEVEVIAHLDVNLEREEIVDGLKIRRVSYLDRKTASFIAKVIAYIKFISQAIRVAKKSDFIHAHDLNTMPIAVFIKIFYNKKVKIIYDAHEYETQMNSLSEKGKKVMYFFEKRLIKFADKTITVSESIAEEYKQLYPNIEQPKLILNCPKYTGIEKKNLFRERFGIANKSTIFLYQGSLSRGRGLEIIVEAFKQTSNKNNVLVMMGYGNLEEYAKKQSATESNVFFHEAVTPNILLNYTSSADFGISTIENTCLSYYYCLPNKMFEYIMAEIPLIVSNLPEMKKVVEANGIGVVAQENTVEGILKAIEKASQLDLSLMNENLKRAKETYNWEEQEKVLINLYRELN